MLFFLEKDGKIYAPTQDGWVACNIINMNVQHISGKNAERVTNSIGCMVSTFDEICARYNLWENNYKFPPKTSESTESTGLVE